MSQRDTTNPHKNTQSLMARVISLSDENNELKHEVLMLERELDSARSAIQQCEEELSFIRQGGDLYRG
jgi:chromosome segregation ATPase